MKKIILFVITVLIALVFSMGCIERKTFNTNNEHSQIVYGMVKGDINFENEELSQFIYDGLVRKDANGKIIFSLAQKADYNEEKNTYTFKIRNNATWSNGDAITAKDFKDFFSKIASKDFHNPYDYELFCIFGLKDYRNGLTDFDHVAIKDLDQSTLEIKLNYNCDYFLDILANPRYFLRKKNDSFSNYEKEISNLKFSGPYKINEIDNRNIKLYKNSYYWNEENIRNKTVSIVNYDNVEELTVAFKSNKVDIFKYPLIGEIENLIRGTQFFNSKSNNDTAILLNPKNNKINDILFKEQINKSIDKKYLCNELLKKMGTPININYEHSSKDDNKETNKKSIDKDKKDNKLKEKLTILYLNNSLNKKICTKIVDDVKKHTGFKIQLKGCFAEEYNGEIEKNNYDMALVNLKKDTNAQYYLNSFSNNSIFKKFNYKNLKYEKLLYKAKIEKDKIKKEKILKECKKILIEEFPIIFLYNNNVYICKNSDLSLKTDYYGNLLIDKIMKKLP